jgi:hypothetical protein
MKIVSISLLISLLSICLQSSYAQTIIDFKNPLIHYMGRVAMRDTAAELTWTASSAVINFNGTGVKATLKDKTGYDFVTVVVDDKVDTVIQLSTDKKEYTLAKGLPAGLHKLELFKRTEFDMGKFWLYNFILEDKGKLLPPPVFKHSIEFYGNSITCGYAIEDTTGKDRGTYEFVNAYKSYANLTARHFNADYRSISKSGIGITVSWFPYVMPDIYDLTDANDRASKWDFRKFTPEIVVVNLFQNDSWIVKMPHNEQFKAKFGTTPPKPEYIIKAYQSFIKSIRSKYPKAKIVCALGSMDATKKGSEWPGYIQKAVAGLKDKSVFTHFFAYKNTPGHPSAKEQKVMADDLIAFIKQKFHW